VKAVEDGEEEKIQQQHYLPMLHNVIPIDAEFVSSER